MKSNHSAPKGKEKSEKSGVFAKGGTTKMFPKMGVKPSMPGVSAPTSTPGFDKAAIKGGRTGVRGKQRGAAPARPGQSSPGGHSGDNTFKASGGKGHMAPFTPASTAKPR